MPRPLLSSQARLLSETACRQTGCPDDLKADEYYSEDASESEMLAREESELLAQEVATVCNSLKTQIWRFAMARELKLTQRQAEIQKERDNLQAENERLRCTLDGAARGHHSDPHSDHGHVPRSRDKVSMGRQLSMYAPPPLADPESTETAGSGSTEQSAGYLQAGSDRSDQYRFSMDQRYSGECSENVDAAQPTLTTSPSNVQAQCPAAVDQDVMMKAFGRIDRDGRGKITAEELLQHMGYIEEDDWEANEEMLKKIREAFRAVGTCEELRGTGDTETLSFESFRRIILIDDVESLVGHFPSQTLRQIKAYYVRATTLDLVQEKTRVSRSAIEDDNHHGPKLPRWLEPTIGVMILFNGLTIGLSLDFAQDWSGWYFIETGCTIFFIFELFVRIRVTGWVEHFFGEGWTWNLFDLVVVFIAVLDAVFFAVASEVDGAPELNNFTIVRLVRLFRVTRIVRLLRMKIFKELTLMVHGVIGGFRTLFWAFIFLGVLVYIFGVVMRQISKDEMGSGGCAANNNICTPQQEIFDKQYDALWRNLYRSMFTVFRCMVGDCNSPDGTPIAPLLGDIYGFTFTAFYVMVMCFVIFGVFNLVMAIFVENTLEAARVNNRKRQMARQAESIRVAKQLRKVVLILCGAELPKPKPTSRLRTQITRMTGLAQADELVSEPTSRLRLNTPSADLNMAVTRDTFMDIMENPRVKTLLEDLEVHIGDKEKLFDIIDANGNGALDVNELIEGLMKLRGPADKGDAVSAALMARQMQRDLRKLEAQMQMWHRRLQADQDKILQRLPDWSTPAAPLFNSESSRRGGASLGLPESRRSNWRLTKTTTLRSSSKGSAA